MSFSAKEDSEENDTPWPVSAVGAFFFIGGLVYFFPHLIKPFGFFEFWTIKGNFWNAVKEAWPWYAWGFGATFMFLLFRNDNISTHNSPMDKFISGVLISVWAGVAEEMAFRWLFFFSAIVILPVSNWIFGGWFGLELIRWLYEDALCPIANFFTFGYLEPYLINGYGWVIGAAVISSNGRFRNGHAYQGTLGLVNSWFFGMYMHWMVFKYGILPAIFVHFLYDFIIFTMEAISSIFDKNRFQSRVRW